MVAGENNAVQGYYVFPRQNLTDKEKIKEYGSIEEWGIAMIRAIDAAAWFNNTRVFQATIYSKLNMLINIDLVRHGKFDKSDFNRLIKPYGADIDFEYPIDLVHYPIINSKIELLKGEEIARPFNFSVINCSDDALNIVQDEKAKMIFEAVQQIFVDEVTKNAQQDTPPEELEQAVQAKIKEIEKYISFSYSDQLENAANSLLKYFLHDQQLLYLFNRSFINYLCTGSEIYCIEYRDKQPFVRMVDPRFFDYDHRSFDDFIDDSMWCREVEYLSASEIIARYYEDLDEDDIEYIEEIKGRYVPTIGLDVFWNLSREYTDSINTTDIRVAHYEWQSLKQVNILFTVDNDTGSEDMEIVDKGYKVKEGQRLEKRWVNERWQGIRIGNDVFLKMAPIPNQYTSLESFTRSQSNYIGLKSSFSIVDKLKPYQYLYNITMFTLKLMMARNKGKGFVMDIAQIPFSKGWDISKWQYYLDNFGIAVINSAEGLDEKEMAKFNQFTAIDRNQGEQIKFFIEQLEFLKHEMADITGITPQREGQVQASETYGGVERSVRQSSAITESIFYLHGLCKQKVMQRLLDKAKALYEPGTKFSYILSNKAREVLEIPEDFALGEFGVFVTDSGDESKLIKEVKQLAQVALQQKELSLDKYIQARGSQSLSEMAAIFKEAQEEANERNNQQAQIGKQAQQEQLNVQMQMQNLEHQNKMEVEQLKANTSIEVAKINAESRVASFRTDVDVDVNDNGILDVVERDKLQLEREKLEADKALRSRELDIKEKDIEGKKELENIKIQNEREKADLEIQKMQADAQTSVIKSDAAAKTAQIQHQNMQQKPNNPNT